MLAIVAIIAGILVMVLWAKVATLEAALLTLANGMTACERELHAKVDRVAADGEREREDWLEKLERSETRVCLKIMRDTEVALMKEAMERQPGGSP